MLSEIVVGVDESEVVSSGHVDTGITGITESAVALMDHADATVFHSPTVT